MFDCMILHLSIDNVPTFSCSLQQPVLHCISLLWCSRVPTLVLL